MTTPTLYKWLLMLEAGRVQEVADEMHRTLHDQRFYTLPVKVDLNKKSVEKNGEKIG